MAIPGRRPWCGAWPVVAGLIAMLGWYAWGDVAKAADVTYTWTGGSSTDWNTASNWSPAAVPSGDLAGGNLSFSGSNTTVTAIAATTVSNIQNVTLSNDEFHIGDSGSLLTWIFKDGGTIVLTSSEPFSTHLSVNIVAQGNLTLTTDGGCDGACVSIGSYTGANTLQLGGNKTFTIDTIGENDLVSVYSAISGSGSLVKTGAGAVILMGNNTYTGATTINEGMLMTYAVGALPSTTDVTIAAGAYLGLQTADQTIRSLSGAGTVLFDDPVTLTVNGSATTTFSGEILGYDADDPSTLIKTGSGVLILSGIVSDANVNVNGGTVTFDGTMTNETITVGSGGTLSGAGTIYSLVNSGTVSPGNDGDVYGTMTINGSYTNNSGSTVVIHVDSAGDCSKLATTGGATISGGTVRVTSACGPYSVGRTYTFLTTGAVVSGSGFSAVASNSAFVDFQLVSLGSDLALQVTRSGNFIDAAVTPNQRAVAAYLDQQRSGASGDLTTVLDQVWNNDAAHARLAYDALSGEIFGSLATVGIENTEGFLTGLANRLRRESMTHGLDFDVARARWDESLLLVSRHKAWLRDAAAGWTTWLEGTGVGASLAGNGNASGLNYATGGLAVGVQRWLEEDLIVGLAGGYSNIGTTLQDRGDHGMIDAGHFGIYFEREFGPSYFTGVAAYGYNAYDTKRYVDIGSLDRTAHAAYGGSSFSFHTEVGRNLRGQFVHFQPYAALEYIQLHQNGFAETGAGAADLSVGGVEADALRGFLGSRLSSYFRTNEGRLITLEGRAAWRHEFLNESRVLDAGFAGQTGAAFAIDGINVDRDAALLGTGLSFDVTKTFKLSANYDLLLSTNYAAHAGTGGAEFAW